MGDASRARPPRAALAAAAGVWLALTLAVLAAMFWTLWWRRDRVLYAGRAPEVQRAEVFRRAGLDPRLLPEVERVRRLWPSHARYALAGGGDSQSYVAYLLAPRIPSGDAGRAAVIAGGRIEASPGGTAPLPAPESRGPWRGGWVLSLALVLGIARLISRALPSAGLSLPEATGLAALLTCGLLTLSKALCGRASPGAAAAAAAGAAGLVLIAARLPGLPRRGGAARAAPGATLWLAGCGGAIAAAVLLSLLLSVVVVPDDWDAWAIWGAKAKVLALGDGPVRDVTWFGHADYPLLWPCLWAFSALCCGGWEEQLCRGWGAVLLLLACWQIGLIAGRLGGSRGAGIFAAALFATIPKAVVVSSWSYAEAPLWLLSVCCLGRLLACADNPGWQTPALAGLFAAAAALAKNEGLLLAALGLGWLALFGAPGRRRGQTAVFAAAPVLFYGPWLVYTRLALGLGSHATEGLGLSAGRLAYAAERLPEAAAAAGQIWLDPRQWGLTAPVAVTALAATAWAGGRTERAALLLPAAMLAAYGAIILLHPADVAWQVSTSWDRLTLQALALAIPAAIPALVRRVAARATPPAGTRG